jgi:hypothetical protein
LNLDTFNTHKPRLISVDEDIRDVYDGEIYKELLDSDVGYLFKKNEAFSFSLNTDGISVCDASNVTIWPIFFVINEIPLEKRFCLDNVIVAGIEKLLILSIY